MNAENTLARFRDAYSRLFVGHHIFWRFLSAAGHDRHRNRAGLAGIGVHLIVFVVPLAGLEGYLKAFA